MSTKMCLLTSTLLATTMLSGAAANAAPVLVSTIDGGYDGSGGYDTPYLAISNSTAYDFTNVSIALRGYQGDNNGVTQVVALGTIAAGTTDTVTWGIGATNGYAVPASGPTPGKLFTYDYDDSYGSQVNEPGCAAQGYGYCAYVGNFQTTLTATWQNPAYNMGAGTEISSVFTPANNASKGFVGWQGLDPSGLSETTYDDHVNTPTGVLANIYVGAPVSLVPEPATWAMMLIGFAGVGHAIRRRRSAVGIVPA